MRGGPGVLRSRRQPLLMDLILFPTSLNDLQILSFGSILAIEDLLSNEHSIFIMPHAYLFVKELTPVC